MRYSPFVRIALALVALIALVGVVRFKPWRLLRSASPRQHLLVGFLPVT